MQNRVKVAFAILLILIFAIAAWFLLQPREPQYQGRSLSSWLDEYNRAGTWDVEPASTAIRAMGTNCLPFLFAHIKHNPSRLTVKLIVLASKQRFLRLPFYGTERYRSASIVALRALGPQASPLCPELLDLTKNPDAFWWANMSLLAIGTNSIPFLELACQNTNRAGSEAVLMIAKLKTQPPPHFSWGSTKALLNGKPVLGLGYAVSSEEVAEIANMLEHPSPAVRRASADALARYTHPAYTNALKSAVPLLIKACGDTNDTVRTSAATTLKLIAPGAATRAGIK